MPQLIGTPGAWTPGSWGAQFQGSPGAERRLPTCSLPTHEVESWLRPRDDLSLGVDDLLGAITFETLVLYPNIFRDAPRSLEAAVDFMKIGPADFFPPVGMLLLATGAGAVILCWRVRTARYWLLTSVLIILFGEFLFSAIFFWPRNTIMFIEGPAVHSSEVLRQTAREFETLHWVRLALCLPASVFSQIGLLRYHRRPVDAARPGDLLPDGWRRT